MIKNGLTPVHNLNKNPDPVLNELGRKLFASEQVSLNGNIACQTCHLDEFSSTDGIPNSIGVGGQGLGTDRMQSRGAIIPRNSLALWGVGGVGYDVLFWDGRVDFKGEQLISQFGESVPSKDPLVVATHLPPLVIREMLQEDGFVTKNKNESITSANEIYKAIVKNLGANEPDLVKDLASYLDVPVEEINFTHVATAISEFIRSEFALKTTKFHRFVFEEGGLTEDEFKGAMVFYGKGKCSTCHSGPYLTDFSFHAIAAPQFGFGKNGFGVDYGRFNVTHNPDDLYKFRTPPLYNVTKTSPYTHSGSLVSLDGVIRAHFDPLKDIDTQSMSFKERNDLYKRLLKASDDLLLIGSLTARDIVQIRAFLETLSFEP